MSIKKQKMSPLTICTHSGTFHADETLAVYMLRLLKKWSDAKVVRSRKPDDWAAADIVVDVGGQYDAVKFFDHHQRGFTGTFNSVYKTKLSSAGLVFKHFGREIISETLKIDLESKDVTFLYNRVYKDFIEAVDANDNGVDKYPDQDSLVPRFRDRNFTLAGVVANMNPAWTEDPTNADFDREFFNASKLMGSAFLKFLTYMGQSFLPAKKYVEEAFNSRFDIDKSGKIILMPRFVPWKEHLYAIEKENNAEGQILYVLFPSGDQWRITAVPVSAGSFDSRKKLPADWCGLRDDALSKESGVPDCVFIHAAGFTGGAKSRESTLKLASLAI